MTTTESRSPAFDLTSAGQGVLQVQPFRSDDDQPDERPTIMLTVRPIRIPPTFWALNATEARQLAASLTAMADDLDAGRWPELGEPGV